jgi:predicted AlkP superfamily phosphohydrolase/phosphomutase
MEKKKKVFVLGIDGAMPEMVFGEWLDELPNIKKLMKEGCYAKLNSTIPPVSGAAWIGMLTGKPPADHGIFEYIYRKNHSYHDVRVITSYNIKEPMISQILSKQNKKSIVCFIPVTYPPKPINGCSITGPMTPQTKDVECTYPKELKQEINSFLGEPLFTDIPDFKNFRNLTKHICFGGIWIKSIGSINQIQSLKIH